MEGQEDGRMYDMKSGGWKRGPKSGRSRIRGLEAAKVKNTRTGCWNNLQKDRKMGGCRI
jgi:hypothetical protein